MDKKLSQTNQFTGGMIKDVEPLLTPKTIMTDCLNGTLITYDGNEYALQNDMGNYCFKNGSLSNGFVPVGMKEHQGILYIISYNPIQNEVEVGSFPSQKTIFNPITDGAGQNLQDIELTATNNKYSDLEKTIELCLFSRDDNFYLNPGDKYLLVLDSDETEGNKNFKELIDTINEKAFWRHLAPYVLTDENKLYNIEQYLKLQAAKNVYNREDYIPVTWEIPGWLAAQFSINAPDEFNVFFDRNMDHITKDEKTGHYIVYSGGNLKAQTFWNSSIYDDNILDQIKDKLIYVLHNERELSEVKDVEGEEKIIDPNGENQLVKYNDFQSIIYYTFTDTNEIIKYAYITPVLKVDDKYIIYDQYTQPIVNQTTEIDPEDITIAQDVFKYYVNDNSISFLFDWEGAQGVVLQYKLARYRKDQDTTKLCTTKDWTTIEDVTNIGDVLLNVTFNLDETLGDTYTDEGTECVTFNKEDVYFLGLRAAVNLDKEDGTREYVGIKYLIDNKDQNTQDASMTSDETKGSNIENWQIIWCTEIVNYFYNLFRNFLEIDEDTHKQNVSPERVASKVNDFLKIALNPTGYTVIRNDILRFSGINIDEKIIDGYLLNDTKENKQSKFTQLQLAEDWDHTSSLEQKMVKTVILQGVKYIIKNTEDESIFELQTPPDQFSKLGRLWRYAVLRNRKDVSLVDSKNNSYTTIYNKENGNETIEFQHNNTFTITARTNILSKEIPEVEGYLFDYMPKNKKVQKPKINGNTLSIVPTWVRCKVHNNGKNKDSSMGFCYSSNTTTSLTFENNQIKTSSNGTLDINKDGGEWAVLNFIEWQKEALDPEKADNRRKKCPTWGGISEGLAKYGFSAMAYDNGAGHSDDYHSDLLGGYWKHNYWATIGFPGREHNIIVHAATYEDYITNGGSQKGNGYLSQDYKKVIRKTWYCYLTMLYYIRYSKRSKVQVTYFNFYDFETNKSADIAIKYINVSGKFDYDYFTDKQNHNSYIERFKTYLLKETEDNNLIETRNAFDLIMSVPLDEDLVDYLNQQINLKNSEVTVAFTTLENKKNIRTHDVYLIDEYDELQNKVKLTSLVEKLVFFSNKIIYENDDTMGYFSQCPFDDKDKHAWVGYEHQGIIYED